MYADEKVVCIVITQNMKYFLEERNSRNIFLDEEKRLSEIFLAIFQNEILTILTPSTSEGGEWGRWGGHVFHFGGP